jgi:hypothetical protein
MRHARVALAALASIHVSACERPPRPEQTAGRLTAQWTGSDTGRMEASARAEWCDSLSLLEIRAMHGDTGLAVAVFPTAAPVTADSYPVDRPSRVGPKPPTSAVAMRWFAETAVRGFQGERGAVVIERVDDRVSGRFHSAMRSVTDTQRIDLSGSFSDVRVVRAARGCVSRPETEPGDSGVD